MGFILAVSGSGFVLQWFGVGVFPLLVIALLAALLWAALRLQALPETGRTGSDATGALAVLRQPVVAWFFAGVFFTVLAHTALYAFFSLYLNALGYSSVSVGFIWAAGVAVEVVWFWFQGAWINRLPMQGWLVVAALASILRFGLVAAFAGQPWLLMLSQGLHALTFAGQHTACIAVINRHFPGRLRGRGQALYTVLGYGLSGVIGGVGGGALSQVYGFASVFWAASGRRAGRRAVLQPGLRAGSTSGRSGLIGPGAASALRDRGGATTFTPEGRFAAHARCSPTSGGGPDGSPFVARHRGAARRAASPTAA